MFHVLPHCLSLLVCNVVTWDTAQATANLLGAFDGVRVPRFPGAMHPFKVWIELTNGKGVTPLKLRVTRLTPEDIDGELLVDIRFTATFIDPRAALKVVLSIDGLELRAPGDHRFSVLARGQSIAERYLAAQLIQPEEGAAT